MIYEFILRFLTYTDQKRVTMLKYTKYVHKLNLTISKTTVK